MRYRRGGYVAVVVCAVGAIAACDAGVIGPHDADPRLRTDVAADGSWERIVRPGFGGGTGFALSLPPGFADVGAQPVDSDAAAYARGSASLTYDFGPYNAQAPAVTAADLVRQSVRVGGRTAVVASWTDDEDRLLLFAWWAGAGQGAAGPNHLLVWAESSDAADRAELLAALYSVTFEP